jgi:flagellar motor switch protein FliG
MQLEPNPTLITKEAYMSIVVTAYGHNGTIDRIAVSSFGGSESNYYSGQGSDAKTYCDTINALELKGEAWVLAKILSENTQYSLNAFLPLKFSNIIPELDSRAIQKILRESDSQDIAKALKGEPETVKEKLFSNMSKRASGMLKEDIEYLGPLAIDEVRKSQENILNIIRRLDQTGEIVIPPHKGELLE